MKLQVIYTFYIGDNECNNNIYRLHYYWIEYISHYVDKMTFVLMHDGNIWDDIVLRVKSKLLSIVKTKEINIIVEPNYTEYREGYYYKKYIIDKLNDYNDYLTFFAHSKGISNPDNYHNIENLYEWINAMYFFNFYYINEMKSKLSNYNTYDSVSNYITFGALYFKDYRHNNVNNWFYSGSFHWLNTSKLYKYIIDNNIDIRGYICEEGERLKRCAELFIGSVLPNKYAAFHNDENYNKDIEHFHHCGWEVSYKKISDIMIQYLTIDEETIFFAVHNDIINKLNLL